MNHTSLLKLLLKVNEQCHDNEALRSSSLIIIQRFCINLLDQLQTSMRHVQMNLPGINDLLASLSKAIAFVHYNKQSSKSEIVAQFGILLLQTSDDFKTSVLDGQIMLFDELLLFIADKKGNIKLDSSRKEKKSQTVDLWAKIMPRFETLARI